MNNPMMMFAMNLINSSPAVRNNPQMRELIGVIESGDAQRGQQIAENLCKTYGMSKEQAIQAARGYFHI